MNTTNHKEAIHTEKSQTMESSGSHCVLYNHSKHHSSHIEKKDIVRGLTCKSQRIKIPCLLRNIKDLGNSRTNPAWQFTEKHRNNTDHSTALVSFLDIK